MLRPMPALEFPRTHVRLLHELAVRLLDSRKPKTATEVLARDLLAGFFDLCMHAGLDRVLVELATVYPAVDLDDRTTLADQPKLCAALVAQLDASDLDGGGPRNAKPKQLTDCLVAALGLTLVDDPDRTITLDHTVRSEVAAALASVVDGALAVPQLRDAILATARAACEPQYLGTFDKVVAQLDDRGLRMIKQPKVPIDASQAVQRVLTDARTAVFARAARAAIDRGKEVLARADAEAAARLDQPVTQRLTPRDVAVLRVCDARVPKVPVAFAESLLASLGELARIAWRAPEVAVRPYAASQTFAVGDVLEHPKFGRGRVISCHAQRIEVEFPDGKYTLVHVRAT